ncbi:conserved hypothetical protein [Chlorobaculum parvum NCIB 8327]|uniref:Uncharacterized protein n=1 Tax=Chlorobaculum parvum (strain DSM 263 / NCIMB 8327) TaxID=517417 RepID=B3QRK1_CHLP8|nr:hypothetical protein [Chlorobaculum parvum]ACF10527.1 conserved hypothetical protein [Chlorobaculum parvum NCIB 8327]
MNNAFIGIPGELLKPHASPCLSIFMPTHRTFPDNAQDSLRFKNLVTKAEADGISLVGKREMAPLIERLRLLQDDASFWKHTLDGLAVFISPDYFRIFRLQDSVIEQARVSDAFYVRPLIRIYQTVERFQVLALTRSEVKLYEGTRDQLDEIELAPEVPKTMTEALGTEVTPPHMTVASYGGTGAAMRHGHSSRKDEEALDNERFFRAVDQGIAEYHSKPSGLPLVLAALPEHQGLFRSISRNPRLFDAGIETDPGALDLEAVRQKAWKVMEPYREQKIDQMIARFREAEGKNLGSDNPYAIATAAVAGNVSLLLLDGRKFWPGQIDPASGDILLDEASQASGRDVLEEMGAAVLARGGEVIVLLPERMPTESGAAAIFRHA